MATIDLGKIKMVWRGTYAGGTAYVPDDVVEYTDGAVTSSYICTANSTGNAPSSGGTVHASWAYMAKGQATSPTTTRGDIIYRGASADQRLAKGTDGQFLKIGASDPEWATVQTDCVKVAEGNAGGSGVTSVMADNLFTSTYSLYKIFITWREDAWFKCRLIDTSGNVYSSAHYDYGGTYAARNRSNNNNSGTHYSEDQVAYFPGNYWNGNDVIPSVTEMTIFRPMDTATYPVGFNHCHAHDGTTFHHHNLGWTCHNPMAYRGINFIADADSMNNSGVGEFLYVVYGYKW